MPPINVASRAAMAVGSVSKCRCRSAEGLEASQSAIADRGGGVKRCKVPLRAAVRVWKCSQRPIRGKQRMNSIFEEKSRGDQRLRRSDWVRA